MLYIALFRVPSTKHNWNFDINVLKNFGSKYSQSLEQLALAEGVRRQSALRKAVRDSHLNRTYIHQKSM